MRYKGTRVRGREGSEGRRGERGDSTVGEEEGKETGGEGRRGVERGGGERWVSKVSRRGESRRGDGGE